MRVGAPSALGATPLPWAAASPHPRDLAATSAHTSLASPAPPQISVPGGLAARLPSADLISVSWSEQWCGLASVVLGRAAGGRIYSWEARGRQTAGPWPGRRLLGGAGRQDG